MRAVNGIRDLAIRIEADPTKFTKAEVTAEYGRFAAGTLLKVNVESFVSTKAKNHRTTGLKQYQITAVSKMVDTKSARGLQIVVIACQDQREVVERDAQGRSSIRTCPRSSR
ncbi:MAG: hypothetical protein HZY73_12645 [Micropruina sp.]|nr:MAG: hypothetical protein HZY73_12645 [Micropruina sp.]